MSTDNPSTQYVCVYTIALLPDADAEAFERRMVDEIMPGFAVFKRNIAGLHAEHHLFKDESGSRADSYVWQIRLKSFHVVSQPSDSAALDVILTAIEGAVGDALAPWGTLGSAAVLAELGSAASA